MLIAAAASTDDLCHMLCSDPCHMQCSDLCHMLCSDACHMLCSLYSWTEKFAEPVAHLEGASLALPVAGLADAGEVTHLGLQFVRFLAMPSLCSTCLCLQIVCPLLQELLGGSCLLDT